MKNRQDRRNHNRNSGQTQRDKRGRYTERDDANYAGSRTNHYQNSGEDYSQDYFQGNRGSNRSRNDWRGGNDGYGVHNVRGENYGFGSQEDNDAYRDFSTQGRNSGLGNQGSYSSYGNKDRQYRDDQNQGYYSRGGNGSQNDYGQSDSRNRNSNWGRSGGMGPSPYPNYGNLDQADMNEGLSNARRSRMNQDNESSGNRYRSERNGDSNSHRGKGPRGYTRSDERIEENINDALTDDD